MDSVYHLPFGMTSIHQTLCMQFFSPNLWCSCIASAFRAMVCLAQVSASFSPRTGKWCLTRVSLSRMQSSSKTATTASEHFDLWHKCSSWLEVSEIPSRAASLNTQTQQVTLWQSTNTSCRKWCLFLIILIFNSSVEELYPVLDIVWAPDEGARCNR